MASFEIIYEEEEDVLEVTFAAFDENFSRTITLNESITLYTNTDMSLVWGLTFYDYVQLLAVNEIDLDGLAPLQEADAQRIMGLLKRLPASLFLQPVEHGALRAIVKAPGLQDLLP